MKFMGEIAEENVQAQFGRKRGLGRTAISEVVSTQNGPSVARSGDAGLRPALAGVLAGQHPTLVEWNHKRLP